MMNNQNAVQVHECCFSWKPIFAGMLVAIGLTFLLNLFSVATGLIVFTTNNDGVEAVVLGGLIASGIGIIACMFASGWLAGYLGQRHCYKRHLGALYGFLTWVTALILSMFIATRAQDFVTFYAHFISGATEVVINNPPASNKAAAVAVAGNMSPKNLVISAYIIFSLFFLSAFASSLGGHCGMRHVCKKEGTC